MTNERNCPECGKSLGADLLDGLCPECMLKVGAATGSKPTVEMSEVPGEHTEVGATPPAFLPDGSTFGTYRIRRRLGHGGMGVVYEAEEIASGRRVALKVIREKLDSPQDRARFLREGRLAASVNHPNCVYVFGTEEIEGIPAIAMEFVSGGTLERRLRHEGPQPIARAVDATLQVIAGLEAAQTRGILHRDIKPSNCFEDEEGTVKVGDFGLSISTAPRAETLVTQTGALIGTPAFCSPEQLRGEELSGRSDMYAVGVMLYQLLTGRIPFEGKTMPQLIAHALERKPPSPQRFRKEIPPGLARVILRCLEKQPSDRFRSYEDLRTALAPYGSTAPTPATLGLRFLAGVLDHIIWNVVIQTAIFFAVGDPFSVMDRFFANPMGFWPFMVASFSLLILYYTLSEWRWGATLGKAVCRVRVVCPDGSYPSPGKALSRAACYVLLPVLPYWAVTILSGDPFRLLGHPTLNSLLGLTQFVTMGLLFATARRRNGFASVYDLLTGTRIVWRSAPEKRRALTSTEAAAPADETAARIGPYHVLQRLGASGDVAWVEGYDLRLLRRVWIRTVPPGTAPWPPALGRLTRVGRLRWLTARRGADESWDAFEGVGGEALVRLCARPQPWEQVRFWLHDLAAELAAAEHDGTMPKRLAPDRVWITEEGRAKLFDVPVPGCNEPDPSTPASSEPPPAPADRARAFLDEVAAYALAGAEDLPPHAAQAALPLPIHARQFLDRLPALPGPGAVAQALRPLLRRNAKITRLRRAAALALCMALPCMACLGFLVFSSLMERWDTERPELMQLQRVLGLWQARGNPVMPRQHLPTEEMIGIYIATHYSNVIADEEVWGGGFARTMISQQARAFAQASVTNYAGASQEERAQADKTLGPLFEHRFPTLTGSRHAMATVMVPGIIVIYVAIPSILAALLFRGGLVLLATGTTFVRRDGRRASRLRLLWRALVTWAPLAAVFVVCAVAMANNAVWPPILAGAALCTLAAASLLLPVRGLQDRLAGTWPVPR